MRDGVRRRWSSPRIGRRGRCRPTAWLLPAACAFALAGAASGSTQAQSARLDSSVQGGETHTTRLGNLPEGAKLAVRVETDGHIRVMLFDEDGFAGFPARETPLFEGRTAGRLSFALRTPHTGDYYLVLDNRAARVSRDFAVAVDASAPQERKTSTDVRAKLERAHAELERLEKNLRRVFVFDELEFKLGRCGTANAFAGGDTVYICAEMGPRLMRGMGDESKARDALLFTMLHEIGHVLLRQWDYPFYDNEEIADEFATVLMVMFGEGARARTQAEYFSTLSPDEELARKRGRDDRHPLSVQRARNIIGWLEDDDLVRRWQGVLVPHMQTRLLKALERQPKEWTDPDLVKQELAQRELD